MPGHLFTHISPDSHLDHGISEAQREYVLGRVDYHDRLPTRPTHAALVTTVTLPPRLGTVPCALHVDVPESEAHWARRGDRSWATRMCLRPPHQTRSVTAVVVWHDDRPTLATMYGGVEAPREPGDPSLEHATKQERARSAAFWKTAALSVDGGS